MSTLATVFGYGLLSARAASSIAGRFYYATDTTLMYRDNGSTWDTLGVGTGTVSADTIWVAAGDLAVGTGTSTAARKAIGAAGAALSVINSAVAWNAGTSFPASKATNDRYYRTDLGHECYWDGTRWLTMVEYPVQMTPREALGSPLSATGVVGFGSTDLGVGGQWITRIALDSYVDTTNDGTRNWSYQLNSYSTAGAATAIGSAFTTAADTASTYTKHAPTIGAAVTAGHVHLRIVATKVSTAGLLYTNATVFYRLIIT